MNRIFVFILFISMIFANMTFANEAEHYIQQYENAQLADFELVHDLDPYQVEDYYKYSWSPYPLFRTSIDLYFKKIHIVPGYYILTPRTIKDRTYIFFKQNGKVVYIIPVCETDIVSPAFYKEKTPEPKRNFFGKVYVKTRRGFYKIFRSGKKQDPPKSYLEASTVDNEYFRVDLYFDMQRNTIYFKKTPDLQ